MTLSEAIRDLRLQVAFRKAEIHDLREHLARLEGALQALEALGREQPEASPE